MAQFARPCFVLFLVEVAQERDCAWFKLQMQRTVDGDLGHKRRFCPTLS